MAQSQTVKLANGQLLCFARPEQDSGNHVHFLKFKAGERSQLCYSGLFPNPSVKAMLVEGQAS